MTTRRQDRYVIRSHRRARFTAAASTARGIIGRHNREISAETVINRLRSAGLSCRRPVRGIVLHQRHRIARLAWARRHIRFTMADWANVLFVDVTRILLRGNDGRARVYRARGERFNENCVVETEPFGGGSIMMFAGISMHTKTSLVPLQGAVNAVRYQNDILLPLVIPHIRANRGMVLAQDNAPCHSARTTQQLLRANNVRLLDWPAKSQDLNPIEHVWDLLKRRVRQLRQHRTLAQLQHDVNQIWRQITQPTIQNYIRSMRQRCRAVIDANGGHTRY